MQTYTNIHTDRDTWARQNPKSFQCHRAQLKAGRLRLYVCVFVCLCRLSHNMNQPVACSLCAVLDDGLKAVFNFWLSFWCFVRYWQFSFVLEVFLVTVANYFFSFNKINIIFNKTHSLLFFYFFLSFLNLSKIKS